MCNLDFGDFHFDEVLLGPKNLQNIVAQNRESVAGFVIQATGMVKFESGLWIGNHIKARNGLQRVRTIPGVQPGVVRTPGFLWGQTEFQSVWVHVAAWC